MTTAPKRHRSAADRRYERTHKGKYVRLKTTAKRRGIPVLITLQEYSAIMESAGGGCVYCDYPLDPTGSSLDRIDSTKGYELGNVRPCCQVCNRAKGGLTESDWVGWIYRVARKAFGHGS